MRPSGYSSTAVVFSTALLVAATGLSASSTAQTAGQLACAKSHAELLQKLDDNYPAPGIANAALAQAGLKLADALGACLRRDHASAANLFREAETALAAPSIALESKR